MWLCRHGSQKAITFRCWGQTSSRLLTQHCLAKTSSHHITGWEIQVPGVTPSTVCLKRHLTQEVQIKPQSSNTTKKEKADTNKSLFLSLIFFFLFMYNHIRCSCKCDFQISGLLLCAYLNLISAPDRRKPYTWLFLFQSEDIKHPNSLIKDLRHKLHNIHASNVFFFPHLIQTLMIKRYQKSVKRDKPSYP